MDFNGGLSSPYRCYCFLDRFFFQLFFFVFQLKQRGGGVGFSNKAEELVMHNKAPMWNESSQVYQLDFGGRVTQESAKNFQIEYRGKQVSKIFLTIYFLVIYAILKGKIIGIYFFFIV